MLELLQRRHSELYRLEHDLLINDFLITDQESIRAITQSERVRRLPEKVLIHEEDDALEVGVFLDREVLGRLAAANPLKELSDEVLSDLWLALEGVSHFNYLVFNAKRETKISLLELEMQAEVDKYVGTLFLAREQGYQNIDQKLYELLFEATRLDEHLDEIEKERYAVASRYAASFCQALRQQHRSDHYQYLAELREFFRLNQPDKLSRIHKLTF